MDLRKPGETIKILEVDGSVESLDVNLRGQIAVSSDMKEFLIADIPKKIVQKGKASSFISDIKFENPESSSLLVSCLILLISIKVLINIIGSNKTIDYIQFNML